MDRPLVDTAADNPPIWEVVWRVTWILVRVAAALLLMQSGTTFVYQGF